MKSIFFYGIKVRGKIEFIIQINMCDETFYGRAETVHSIIGDMCKDYWWKIEQMLAIGI